MARSILSAFGEGLVGQMMGFEIAPDGLYVG
jgi:hypothetical protein